MARGDTRRRRRSWEGPRGPTGSQGRGSSGGRPRWGAVAAGGRRGRGRGIPGAPPRSPPLSPSPAAAPAPLFRLRGRRRAAGVRGPQRDRHNCRHFRPATPRHRRLVSQWGEAGGRRQGRQPMEARGVAGPLRGGAWPLLRPPRGSGGARWSARAAAGPPVPTAPRPRVPASPQCVPKGLRAHSPVSP